MRHMLVVTNMAAFILGASTMLIGIIFGVAIGTGFTSEKKKDES